MGSRSPSRDFFPCGHLISHLLPSPGAEDVAGRGLDEFRFNATMGQMRRVVAAGSRSPISIPVPVLFKICFKNHSCFMVQGRLVHTHSVCGRRRNPNATSRRGPGENCFNDLNNLEGSRSVAKRLVTQAATFSPEFSPTDSAKSLPPFAIERKQRKQSVVYIVIEEIRKCTTHYFKSTFTGQGSSLNW